jgi:hypothetical protein
MHDIFLLTLVKNKGEAELAKQSKALLLKHSHPELRDPVAHIIPIFVADDGSLALLEDNDIDKLKQRTSQNPLVYIDGHGFIKIAPGTQGTADEIDTSCAVSFVPYGVDATTPAKGMRVDASTVVDQIIQPYFHGCRQLDCHLLACQSGTPMNPQLTEDHLTRFDTAGWSQVRSGNLHQQMSNALQASMPQVKSRVIAHVGDVTSFIFTGGEIRLTPPGETHAVDQLLLLRANYFAQGVPAKIATEIVNEWQQLIKTGSKQARQLGALITQLNEFLPVEKQLDASEWQTDEFASRMKGLVKEVAQISAIEFKDCCDSICANTVSMSPATTVLKADRQDYFFSELINPENHRYLAKQAEETMTNTVALILGKPEQAFAKQLKSHVMQYLKQCSTTLDMSEIDNVIDDFHLAKPKSGINGFFSRSIASSAQQQDIRDEFKKALAPVVGLAKDFGMKSPETVPQASSTLRL